jgi:hypothetical protein
MDAVSTIFALILYYRDVAVTAPQEPQILKCDLERTLYEFVKYNCRLLVMNEVGIKHPSSKALEA